MHENNGEQNFRDSAKGWLRCYDVCAASGRRGQGSTAKHGELLAALATLRNEVGIARGYSSFHSRRNTANIHFFVHGIVPTIVSVAGAPCPTMQQE